ncbi:G-D-S-L family lipolytic protein [uncultured Flavobacterium sp.]|uniref:G-D-S-L family lipolytic protein n=1 Tax=uncultured Flavobacterium sp. TaxID=165435 RepID=UPI0030EB39C0
MKNKFIYLSVLAMAGLVSCEPEFENAVDANYTAGEADFSSYVAVGNSLTAGYMDGTVSIGGQANSFPNLLSQQFATVGGGVFTQPSYEEDVNNLGGISGLPGFNTRLVINASVGAPQPLAGTSTITLTPQATAYNNMGVPGAKSFHLLVPGYGNPANFPAANPYYVRHATSNTATVLGDAMTKNPTFFTNWIGANDVLSYATTGGVGVDQTGNFNPQTYGPNDITDPTVFAGVYSLIVNGGTSPAFGAVTGLSQNGAKGVVATIPSVTSIPFFTTVPYNPVTAAAVGGASNITALNAQLYGPLKQALTAFGAGSRINLLSATAGNPLLIKDESLTNLSAQLTAAFTPTLGAATAAFYGSVFGQARQATADDLVLLTTSGVIGTAPAGVPAPLDKYGVTYPLQDQHILIPSEQLAIANATNAYNAAIKSIAASKNLAVADMNAILGVLVNGLRSVNGQIYTANYFSGAATENKVLFSLDGVHPNSRGYAVIANEIIKVINAHYKSNMPFLNPSYFPGINIVATN